MLKALIALLSVMLASGCSCGGLEVDGPTPYQRCVAMDPPSARDVTVGGVHLTVEDRTVTIEAPAPTRVAVARGPAGSGEPIVPGLDVLEASSPSVVILLGDLGDGAGTEPASVAALVAALGQLTIPVLLLPGGRDAPSLRDALPSDGSIVDLMGVRAVRIGSLELVPLPGAPDGRYGTGGCGLSGDDVAMVAGDLDDAVGTRLVLSTFAPATVDPRTAGMDGHEAASAVLADALTSLAARGGIYALPEAEVGVPFDGTTRAAVPTAGITTLHLVVPRWLGPATERTDGSRQASGVMLLEVREGGVAVVEAPR